MIFDTNHESTLQQIKNSVRGKVISIALVIITFILVAVTIELRKKRLNSEFAALSSETWRLHHLNLDLEQRRERFSDDLLLWNSIADQLMDRLYIAGAREIIGELGEKYNCIFTPLISPPKPITLQHKHTVALVASIISLSFSCLTDAGFYCFLEELITRFPGYVNIDQLKISRIKEVEMARPLNKKEHLVGGEVVFRWYAIDYDK